MGTGYTRNDTANNIADGNIINASDLDGEFDAVQSAFDASTGHTHDGTAGEGAPIETIGPSQDVVATASVLRPKTDNTVDLGTTSLEYKDLFLDGTAHIDTLDVDENASITGTLGVTGTTTLGTANITTGTITTADINGGNIDGTIIGATTAAAITGTTITGTSFVTSGDMTFGDNDKAIFGAGSDLQIYAASGVSFIKESGAGNLNVNAANFILNNADDSQNMFKAKAGAEVELYYNNAQKLETTATGIDVTGNATFADNGKAIFGAGSDLQIYHDGSHSYVSDQGTGNIKILADDFIVKNAADTETMIQAFTDSAVSLWYDNSAKLATTSTGVDITGTLVSDGLNVEIVDNDAGPVTIQQGGNSYFKIVTTNSSESVQLGNSTTNPDILLGSGNVGIGTSSPTAYGNSQATLVIEGDTNPALAISDTGQARDWYIVGFGDGLGIRYADGGGSGSASNVTESAFFKNNGNVGIGTSSPSDLLELSGSTAQPAIRLTDSDVSGLYHRIFTPTNTGLAISADTGNVAADSFIRLDVDGTEKMRIDSSGRLLLGNTDGSYASANADNIVMGDRTSSAESGITFGSTLGSSLRFADAGAVGQGIIQYVHDDTVNTDYMNFYTAATERMRIDSSGNLLVGKSVTTQNTAGTQISASSGVRATVDGNVATILNRTTSDGDIALFRKDGTTVGIVASRGGVATNLILRTATGQGAGIGGANSGVLPCDEDGLQDDEINLGASGTRWNDLYLSGRLTNDGTGGVAVDSGGDVEIIQEGTGRLKAVGGVFIGGAAAGNHLDDYEEGTWTPVGADASSGGNTASAGTASGFYTKIGRQVTAHCTLSNINTTGMTSGSGFFIQGLPFAHNSTTGRNVTGVVRADKIDVDPTCFGMVALISSGASTAQLYQNRDNTTDTQILVSDFQSGTADLFFSITYDAT